MAGNTDDKKKDLDEAKQELSAMHGRPFDVDKVLAENRARQERERMARATAEGKLEEEHKRARERRHELRARELEKRAEVLVEKQEHLEEARHQFEKRGPERDTGKREVEKRPEKKKAEKEKDKHE